jgi:phosphate uptake regulator
MNEHDVDDLKREVRRLNGLVRMHADALVISTTKVKERDMKIAKLEDKVDELIDQSWNDE